GRAGNRRMGLAAECVRQRADRERGRMTHCLSKPQRPQRASDGAMGLELRELRQERDCHGAGNSLAPRNDWRGSPFNLARRRSRYGTSRNSKRGAVAPQSSTR
ncbi:MAG: hypothetical protein MUQ10_02320, partial [Anaerolineae bacterium]|nr:hypothetical protein [Anaerolineae bacterium]